MAAKSRLNKTASLRILERMLVIRRFEESLVAMSGEKLFKSHYHLYIGQEATGAAVVESLRRDDKLVTTHRNHGHVLARGADPGKAYAEILGRATGLNGGRGGTLHMSDPEHGFLATSAIVGGCIGLALGGAFAQKRRGKGGVSVGFFGDGSLEEGISFESMNIAALWKLPAVFLCENNGAGATGSAKGGFPSSLISAPRLCGIAESLAIDSKSVDGRDVEAVHAAVAAGVARCREGRGPVFIECVTERWEGSKPMWPELSTGVTDVAMAWEPDKIPRTFRDWYVKQDPILLFIRKLLKKKLCSGDEILKLDRHVRARDAKARQLAVESPMPRGKTALDHVFAMDGAR
ncbi:MAG: thiamine pyrophosphate-dependent dehydrogenase E1 component subunit alpha [Burkholderiales bacterium]